MLVLLASISTPCISLLFALLHNFADCLSHLSRAFHVHGTSKNAENSVLARNLLDCIYYNIGIRESSRNPSIGTGSNLVRARNFPFKLKLFPLSSSISIFLIKFQNFTVINFRCGLGICGILVMVLRSSHSSLEWVYAFNRI